MSQVPILARTQIPHMSMGIPIVTPMLRMISLTSLQEEEHLGKDRYVW